MLKASFWLALGSLATVHSATPAHAQEQRSFNAVLASGFEIKSVVLIPMEAVKRVAPASTSDAVVVTLQNRREVVVCFIGLPNWLNLNKTSLDNATLCEAR